MSVYDKYGNKLGDIKSDNGKFSFNAGFEPIYITGNINKFELSQNEIFVSKNSQNVSSGDTVRVNISDSRNRSLRTDIISPGAVKTENINSSGGTIGFDARIGGLGKAEDSLTVKLYNGNDLVYIAKTHFMQRSLTLNKITGTGINDGTLDMGTKTADIEIFAENVRPDSAAKLITAYYADDGTLMKTDLTDIVAEKRGVLNQSVELDIPSGCHKIKFFLFGSEKNIIPFSKPLICYVNN